MEVTEVPWTDPVGAALREAQRAELFSRYGPENPEPGPHPTAEDVHAFLLARTPDGAPVGCGALRILAPGTAELKRMYVIPPARGTGVATTLLRALESRAREAEIRTLVLEAGTEQPEAIRFYRREGYREIPLFGPYVDSPLSRCFRLDL
ncbi:GNAT superfamily N-acetyltransferase [Crossiella equi]|uniref:GNAT superfamily N-acetyltransferase n=1 Tax=Crossiella equi TaxID=130796 RepID=A0ABS5AR82_9PSEU|nr:GNAT family N-acetyltransferase [Crossiella equi]MBP2479084.1 GNAT superfamily N-acetyltransferase [Crossiella equi]